MKLKILILLCISALCSFSKLNPEVDNFTDFIRRNFNPPESVQRICVWQYVILKVQIDRTNKVINYSIMNPVANGLDSSFNFIRGYQFSKKAVWSQKNLILCIGLQNNRIDACDTVTNDGHPTPLMELKKFKKTYKKNDAVFIYKNLYKIIEDRIR
jgi:hypothetical protein